MTHTPGTQVRPEVSVSTEISEETARETPILYYDAECALCANLVDRLGPALADRGVLHRPLQSPGTAASLGVPADRLLEEIRLRTRDGRVLGGAEAVLFLLPEAWWSAPLRWLDGLRAGRWLLQTAYRWIARHRHFLGARHRTDPTRREER